MYQIGIDEAGVGPVLGPMIVSGVLVHKASLPELQAMGVKDSKKFSSLAAREKTLAKAVPFCLKAATFEISAAELDNGNWIDLEIAKIAAILQELTWLKAGIIYIPQIGKMKQSTLISKLAEFNRDFLTDAFTKKVIYEVDADSKFLPVSLASMFAKTARDQKIVALCQELNEPYISGYPNKKTAAFLKNYFHKHKKLPHGVRRNRNWAPLRELL